MSLAASPGLILSCDVAGCDQTWNGAAGEGPSAVRDEAHDVVAWGHEDGLDFCEEHWTEEDVAAAKAARAPADGACAPVWRTGRTLGRTLYHKGKCIGMVDTVDIAELIVLVLNAVDHGALAPCSCASVEPTEPAAPDVVETAGRPAGEGHAGSASGAADSGAAATEDTGPFPTASCDWCKAQVVDIAEHRCPPEIDTAHWEAEAGYQAHLAAARASGLDVYPPLSAEKLAELAAEDEVDEDAETKALRTLDADAGEAPASVEPYCPGCGTTTQERATLAEREAEIAALKAEVEEAAGLLEQASEGLRQAEDVIRDEVEDADLDVGYGPFRKEIKSWRAKYEARRAGR